MDNKKLIGFILLFGGAITLMTAIFNAFLVGFGFISEEAIIPLCIVSLIVFFSGLILLITKRGLNMDEIEYRTRLVVIRTAIGSEESFKDFVKKGINRAKKIIADLLEKSTTGLSYGELEFFVKKELEGVNIRNWTDAWKSDAFMLALAELEIKENKIREINGIFSLIK